MNPTIMEMKMVLDLLSRSIYSVEEAQRSLEIQHRDLTNQADYIRKEIKKALAEAPKPTTDLDVLWERMKPHWKGDMGPAYIFVKEVEHLFKP